MAKAEFFSVAIAMALVLSVGLAALAPGEVLAQPPYWAKTYGGGDLDVAMSIQQTSDGGYIVAGSTRSFGGGADDFWVLKLYSNGNVAWQKTYGGASDDSLYSIQQTSDGGYIVAGSTRSFGAGDRDFWVLKLDVNGNVTWQKTYGGQYSDEAPFIRQTSEGGYIVAGWTWSFGAGHRDFWVLKLDASGNVTWQKTYGGENLDVPRSIQQTSEGGYIVAGYTRSFGAGSDDYWVLKLEATGNVTWQKTYGGQYSDEARSIQQTSAGGYIVAGDTESFGAGLENYWVLKLEANGNVTWQKTYGGESYDVAMSIQWTPNGGYIVAGFTASFGAGFGDDDYWVLKLDANGSIPDCPLGVASDAVITDTTVPDVYTGISGENTDADIDSPEYETSDTDCAIDTQCYYSPPQPIGVPTMNQWGRAAMITLFAGLLAWVARRRRPTSGTGS